MLGVCAAGAFALNVCTSRLTKAYGRWVCLCASACVHARRCGRFRDRPCVCGAPHKRMMHKAHIQHARTLCAGRRGRLGRSPSRHAGGRIWHLHRHRGTGQQLGGGSGSRACALLACAPQGSSWVVGWAREHAPCLLAHHRAAAGWWVGLESTRPACLRTTGQQLGGGSGSRARALLACAPQGSSWVVGRAREHALCLLAHHRAAAGWWVGLESTRPACMRTTVCDLSAQMVRCDP